MGIFLLKHSKNYFKMSEWVVIDITSFTKTTTHDKVLKILKAAKVDCCDIKGPYMNEARNKNCLSITIRRSHFEDESKTPDYPGSWILEEDYSQRRGPLGEPSPPLFPLLLEECSAATAS